MSAKHRFFDFVQAQAWERIGANEWSALRVAFPDRTENCLRGWLAESGAAVEPPYAGVGVKTLAELERSLLAIGKIYAQNPEARKLCRAVVIHAKDRARFASKNVRAAPEKRALKEEMVQWMLVWLGDPALFAEWVGLRKQSIG